MLLLLLLSLQPDATAQLDDSTTFKLVPTGTKALLHNVVALVVLLVDDVALEGIHVPDTQPGSNQSQVPSTRSLLVRCGFVFSFLAGKLPGNMQSQSDPKGDKRTTGVSGSVSTTGCGRSRLTSFFGATSAWLGPNGDRYQVVGGCYQRGLASSRRHVKGDRGNLLPSFLAW
uniref:Secreted protein n=1 Tax=Peronospora matthiolae TaxID=2874970 RepID=A0AAV1TI12_9STRA